MRESEKRDRKNERKKKRKKTRERFATPVYAQRKDFFNYGRCNCVDYAITISYYSSGICLRVEKMNIQKIK
jgi:hypothetical protein